MHALPSLGDAGRAGKGLQLLLLPLMGAEMVLGWIRAQLHIAPGRKIKAPLLFHWVLAMDGIRLS